jgi:protein SCO1/2
MRCSLLTTMNLKILKFVVGILVVASSLVVTAESLPYYASEEFTPHWLGSNAEVQDDFHQIPSFSFINQDGKRITDQSFENKIYVAGFFFSTCPGICPTIRSKLSMVQEKFIGNPDVQILQHSIQPTTDTVEVLKNYADAHGIKSETWHLVTGEKEEIYSLAKSAYFASEDLGSIQKSSDFLHTESLLLIDQNRHVRGVYNGLNTASVNYLMDDIQTLIAEMDAAVIGQ